MWKNRVCYLLFTAVFAGFLFFFGRPYLIIVLAGLLGIPVLLWLFLFYDAKKITVKTEIPSGSREGRTVPLILNIRRKGILWAAGSVAVEIEWYHTMYGIKEQKRLFLPLSGKKFNYGMPVNTEYCGELRVHCNSVRVYDLLNLFSVPTEVFREVCTMIYPRRMNMNVELSKNAVGSPQNDGILQNRKGNDPSEIFDLREYAPGDDIRAIHWKLSGKLDRLVVKEASDPAHYQVILMPDLGHEQLQKKDGIQHLNMAVAICSSVGEQLIQQGTAFYMAIPESYGLQLCEVRNAREFQEILSRWMSMELPEKSGTGWQYFGLDHLEQYFSKLLIVSAGKYLQELSNMEGRISITVISAVNDQKFMHIKLNNFCDLAEIPTEQKNDETYRVIC